MVKEINNESFRKEVIESRIPVLVDFWASWCGPCMQLTPIFERLSAEFEGKLKFCKINVDDNQKSAAQHGIRGIPCLIVFGKGKEAERIVGFISENDLRRKLDIILTKI